MKSLASSDKSCGNEGSVGCVAILNKAAIGSNSDHGGFVVNISTTVQPRLLETSDKQLQKENSPKCFGYNSCKLPVENFVLREEFLRSDPVFFRLSYLNLLQHRKEKNATHHKLLR